MKMITGAIMQTSFFEAEGNLQWDFNFQESESTDNTSGRYSSDGIQNICLDVLLRTKSCQQGIQTNHKQRNISVP